jgi:hypothetical protein
LKFVKELQKATKQIDIIPNYVSPFLLRLPSVGKSDWRHLRIIIILVVVVVEIDPG